MQISKINTLYYAISKKTTLINMTINCIRRIFNYRKAIKLTVVDNVYRQF